MLNKCDSRPCILKFAPNGEDTVVVFEDKEQTKPMRYKCTCEALFAKVEVIASLHWGVLQGRIGLGAALSALEIRPVYLDVDTTAEPTVECTTDAQEFLARFRGT